MGIELPSILNIPAKLLPIITQFNEFRFWLLEGGRGGAKSQSIGRLLLYIAEKYKVRICCGRETQVTIEESVYTLLKDLIIEFNLNFEVFANKIVHRVTGSAFTFKGFREQGAVNIKGLEGIDILYIDEAQSITKHTLDIILPTIRKEKSKIFFSMNRYLKNDPVFAEFSVRKDCKHISISYLENRYCPKVLLIEAETCKAKDEADYKHIWLGQPVVDADNYLFSSDDIDSFHKAECLDNPASFGQRILGVDLARYGQNSSVATILEHQGIEFWAEIAREKWDKKDLMDSTGRITDIRYRYKPTISVIDGDGLGAGVVDRLIETSGNSINDIVEFRGGLPLPKDDPGFRKYANNKTKAYYLMKEMGQMNRLKLISPETIKELEQIRFEYSSSGVKRIMPKERMEILYKIKKLDNADSTMMAVSEIPNIYKVYEQSQARLPASSILDDDIPSTGLRGLPAYTGMA